MSRLSLTFMAGTVLGLSVLLVGGVSRDVLGDFSSVVNDPGYLSFSEDAPSFRGNLKLPKRVEGVSVENRPPARVLFEDYVNHDTRLLNSEAVQRTIEDFQETHAAHLTAYCVKELVEDYDGDVRDPDSGEPTPAFLAMTDEAAEECRNVPKAILEKWEERKDYAAYRFVAERLAEAHQVAGNLNAAGVTIDEFNEDLPDVTSFKRSLFDALEVSESLRLDHAGVTNRSHGLRSLFSLLRNYMREHRLQIGRPEATNLLVPESRAELYPRQRFFSPDQLNSYEGDLAQLDPPNSGFWRKPTWDISSFSMTDYNRLGVSSLRHHRDKDQFETIDEQVEAIIDKTVPIRVVYEPDELKGRTPKVTVKLDNQNWKLKYVTDKRSTKRQTSPSKIYQKRWLGSEVNVEPVVNHLAAAIGYTVDPTYYQERVHLYFKNKVYKGPASEREARFLDARAEMISALASVYPDANVASAFQNIRIDEDGRRFIEVRSATLEKKSDAASDINLGYFVRGGYGKSFKREFRAFGVFLAWISDPDIKDANVKAKLVPVVESDGGDGYRLVYSASDMGGALGAGFPNLLGKDLVRAIGRDLRGRPVAVHFTFRSIYPAPLLASASFADARWIARMIGQLSRDQIFEAFQYAGCPDVVARYYTEILLRRRDQLLASLGLMGKEVVGADGRVLRFVPLSRIENPRRFHVEGEADYFRRGFLRDRSQALFDSSKTYFPRHWGTKYPWDR